MLVSARHRPTTLTRCTDVRILGTCCGRRCLSQMRYPLPLAASHSLATRICACLASAFRVQRTIPKESLRPQTIIAMIKQHGACTSVEAIQNYRAWGQEGVQP